METKEKMIQTRKRLKMSQARFARVMGVDRVSIWRWENGKRKPNGSAVKLIGIYHNILTTP